MTIEVDTIYKAEELKNVPAGSIATASTSVLYNRPAYYFTFLENGRIVSTSGKSCNLTGYGEGYNPYVTFDWEIKFVYVPYQAQLGPIDPSDLNSLPVSALIKWNWSGDIQRFHRREYDWVNIDTPDNLADNWTWADIGTYTVIDLPEVK